eukprot:m.40163 g.40163  ORF g.40163 m.40163 type:complete len:131 (+) comp12730_c0_seq2:2-394(+)
MAQASDAHRTLRDISRVEKLAQDVLQLKHQSQELERRRNQDRQAVRQLQRDSEKSDKRVWTSVGPLLIKLPQKEVVRQLQAGLDELDKQKVATRDEMKTKLAQLQEEQGGSMPAGFDLQGVSQGDIYADL